MPSPSISIPVADTLRLRPPLGGAISSLRRNSSRTLPKLMLRDRRRLSLHRGVRKLVLPPIAAAVSTVAGRGWNRVDQGGLECFPDIVVGMGRARPGGAGPGRGSGGRWGTSRNKFWGEGTMGSNDGVPTKTASWHPGPCWTPTCLPPRLRSQCLPRTTTMTTTAVASPRRRAAALAAVAAAGRLPTRG